MNLYGEKITLQSIVEICVELEKIRYSYAHISSNIVQEELSKFEKSLYDKLYGYIKYLEITKK